MAATQQKRSSISNFAQFFRNYGIALGVIIAAMPLATKAVNLLPIYSATKDILTFATTLLSLLAVAIMFGVRRSIGQAVFPHSQTRCITSAAHRRRAIFGVLWPTLLGFLAVVSLAAYLTFLNLSINDILSADAKDKLAASTVATPTAIPAVTPHQELNMDRILAQTPLVAIPYLAEVMISYAAMFFGAATAFVWLGLIEYMQQELRITDSELITKPYTLMTRCDFKIDADASEAESAPYLYFEYDPRDKKPTPHVTGPLCGRHHRLLKYDCKVGLGVHRWRCVNPEKVKDQHSLDLSHDTVDMATRAKDEAARLLAAALP